MNTPQNSHLKTIERRLLWLSHWMIYNANHIRPKVDGIKVGGHQASSASMVSIMTALYFSALRPVDRVAVKPHASPIFHAIQYLMGNQTFEKMENFRGFGGVQSYPSRTKDIDDVDFSTGSVGLGVAITSFASIVQDYIQAKTWGKDQRLGRMIALVGDAELDEGNIYEALQEGWKNDLRNCWWIIDYNRQSLDGVVREGLFKRVEQIFEAFGWDVVRVKYGTLQRAAFAASSISKTNCTVFFITQLREKIGVMFGNPETTTGGNALKFYASVRIDIRRSTQLKDTEGGVLGNKTRVKIVKNKVAPPFKTAEFDIMYGEGISKIGEILDIGVELDIIEKSGSWFSYGGSKLGQGRDSVKSILKDNPELMEELEQKIIEQLKSD